MLVIKIKNISHLLYILRNDKASKYHDKLCIRVCVRVFE